MSTKFPSLAQAMAYHRPYGLDCRCGIPINSDQGWAQHVEREWHAECKVTTEEQLDALPIGTVVRQIQDPDNDPATLEKLPNPMRAEWYLTGTSGPERKLKPFLPMRVIYHPDWAVAS